MPNKDPILDKAWHREYYLKNKERLNEQNKILHKEKLKERKTQQKEYREKNKARHKKKKYRYRDYQRQWEQKNRQRKYKKELNLYLKYGKFFNLNSYEFKSVLTAWSNLVRNRDQSCLQCGNPSTVSHHIIFKKTMPKLSLNLNNGIALCIPCHKEIHKLNGY